MAIGGHVWPGSVACYFGWTEVQLLLESWELLPKWTAKPRFSSAVIVAFGCVLLVGCWAEAHRYNYWDAGAT